MKLKDMVKQIMLEDVFDKEIKNPKTGNKIKVRTALQLILTFVKYLYLSPLSFTRCSIIHCLFTTKVFSKSIHDFVFGQYTH